MIYEHKAAWEGDLPIMEKADGVPIEYDFESEPLRAECEAFINLIRFNKEVPSDGEEGLRVLQVLKEADIDLKKRDKDDH